MWLYWVFEGRDPWGPVRTQGRGGRWMRRRSEALPRTPLWSRNDVGIVRVGSLWMTMSFGSQMVRWSMHVAWSGFDGGRNVGVE